MSEYSKHVSKGKAGRAARSIATPTLAAGYSSFVCFRNIACANQQPLRETQRERKISTHGDLIVALLHRHPQRADAALVRDLSIRPRLQQQPHLPESPTSDKLRCAEHHEV